MSAVDHTRLARLRPEKFDDAAVKEQISRIQQACEDVDPEIIAVVFHECNQNMQQTIDRLRAGDYEDGGWQQARPSNKKKNHLTNHQHPGDQIVNGNPADNSERSLSQRTSPTSSLRDGYRRHERYPYSSASIRPSTERRGNDFSRNYFNPSNPPYAPRSRPVNKPIPSTKPSTPFQPKPSEIPSPSDHSTDKRPEETAPAVVSNASANGAPQSANSESMDKKSSTRRMTPAIPFKPVSMHRTIKFSSEPIDIQFGDVQWNDSVPTTVTPSDSTPVSTSLNNHERETFARGTHDEHEQRLDTNDGLASTHITTDESELQFLETANQLSSSLAITDNTPANNSSLVPAEGTSHLSDHLTGPSSPVSAQTSSQPAGTVPIPITRLPPTSTPRASEYTSPTSQFIPHNAQQPNPNTMHSASTSLTNLGNYPWVVRDYPQGAKWNSPSSNYKVNSKPPVFSTGPYPQQSTFQFPPTQQTQQLYYGAYPYTALSPSVLQVLTRVDSWPNAGYPTSMDTYSYPQNNYPPTYSTQPQYHPTPKYDQHSYDKEFFSNYGQTRSTSNDALYQQQQQQSSTTTQPAKETPTTSKLSPTAAAFSHGAPLTASPSATALYMNPVAFPMTNYPPTVGGSLHQDRFYPYSSADNSDNRNGASYGSITNRGNYYSYDQQQQQQQRTHHNNASNSTWH